MKYHVIKCQFGDDFARIINEASQKGWRVQNCGYTNEVWWAVLSREVKK